MTAPEPAPEPQRRSTYVEAVALYEQGLEALQRHAYQQAADLLESVLRQYPEERELHERVRLYLNICKRQATQREAAPQTIDERLYAATLSINGGQYDQAIAHLRLVRDEDPGEPIDREAGQADGLEAGIDQAGTAIDRGDGKHRDDGRQGRRDAEERQEQAPAGEAAPRQRERQHCAEGERQDCREPGLHCRKSGDRCEIGQVGDDATLAEPRNEQRAERQRQQRRKCREDDDAGHHEQASPGGRIMPATSFGHGGQPLIDPGAALCGELRRIRRQRLRGHVDRLEARRQSG